MREAVRTLLGMAGEAGRGCRWHQSMGANAIVGEKRHRIAKGRAKPPPQSNRSAGAQTGRDLMRES